MPDRAIIYTRVSSDKAGGRSVAEQESDCRTICERNGWPVAEVVVDNDVSASRYARKERPGFRRLWEILRPGDVLVLWEASRAQRDLKAYLELRELCASRGILLSYSGRTYDLTEGEDRFSTGLDALMAERYAEEARQRVMRAHRANIEAGRPHGRLPYGYAAERNSHGRIVKRVPDPAEAPVVRELYRRVLAGETLYAVSQDLNERRVTPPGTGQRWYPTTIRHILLRATYAGLRTHQGSVTGKGTWEALVPVEDFEQAQALLMDPARDPVRPGVKPKYLLSGIATCGVCGRPVERIKGYQGRDMYTCPDKARHTQRPVQPVDELAVEYLMTVLTDPRLLRRVAADLADEEAGDPASAAILVASLRQRLDEFAEAAAHGEITPAMLAKVEANLLEQIEEAERKAGASQSTLARMAGPKAQEIWDGLTLDQQREVVRTALDIVIRPVGRGRRGYDVAGTVDISWRE